MVNQEVVQEVVAPAAAVEAEVAVQVVVEADQEEVEVVALQAVGLQQVVVEGATVE